MSETTIHEVTSPMIEMDAREFGLHLKEGGWRLGLLVARSVEPGEGDGAHRSSRGARPGSEKVSATWFAEQAGTSHKRVMRYYRAWERASEKGKVPAADELEPGLEPELDWASLPRWKSFFAPSAWDGGATGPMNLTYKLGQYGDRLRRTHNRLLYFIERELPDEKRIGKQTRELAASYAEAHEAEARILRQIADGTKPDAEETRAALDPTQFFKS